MGKKKRDPDELARLVQVGLARGLDLVDAFRVAADRLPMSTDPTARQLERAHQQAVEKHTKSVRRYEKKQARLHSQVTTGAVGAVAGGALFLAAIPGAMELWGFAGLAAGAACGISALTARRRLHEITPPPPLQVTAPPPPPLPAGARGAPESQRLTQLRIQLAQVVPAVERLHPGAGEELRRADAEAAPPLSALVERLSVLDRMERTMPGTSAATAAAAAAEELPRGRLAAGCATYERLLAASATLLAAPDIGRSTDEVLGPALEAMSAYAHGLATSAQTFSPGPA